jgi:hypothetical protein
VSAPRRRGGDRGKVAATITTSTNHSNKATDEPTVNALTFRRSGRRSLPLVVVVRCPFCSVGGHAHRGHGRRHAGCDGGAYVIPRPA